MVAEPRNRAIIEAADPGSLQRYERFCKDALFAPPQDPLWLRAFAAECNPDVVIATLLCGGQPALMLAVEIVGSGPFRTARFPGGRHANGNVAAFDPGVTSRQDLSEADLKILFDAIGAARPDVDALVLERQAETIGGVRNPLAGLRHSVSPNLALAVDLDGGFEALLARSSGKRKRKKHRSQTRKFEAAGGFERAEAKSDAEIDRTLDAFFAMKTVRFARMGVEDVFAPDGVRGAFRTLFKAARADSQPRFVLHSLSVAGEIRAVTGSSLTGNRVVCEFGAIREDDLAHTSPGDFLFFDNIREACSKGFSVYDFSVGDEPYKRLWCDLESTQFDVFAGLTAKGQALVTARRATASLKRTIKNNRAIWAIVKRLRKRAAAPEAPSSEE